eukprot:1176789-Prorocentrum_minimum.AAC.1
MSYVLSPPPNFRIPKRITTSMNWDRVSALFAPCELRDRADCEQQIGNDRGALGRDTCGGLRVWDRRSERLQRTASVGSGSKGGMRAADRERWIGIEGGDALQRTASVGSKERMLAADHERRIRIKGADALQRTASVGSKERMLAADRERRIEGADAFGAGQDGSQRGWSCQGINQKIGLVREGPHLHLGGIGGDLGGVEEGLALVQLDALDRAAPIASHRPPPVSGTIGSAGSGALWHILSPLLLSPSARAHDFLPTAANAPLEPKFNKAAKKIKANYEK